MILNRNVRSPARKMKGGMPVHPEQVSCRVWRSWNNWAGEKIQILICTIFVDSILFYESCDNYAACPGGFRSITKLSVSLYFVGYI